MDQTLYTYLQHMRSRLPPLAWRMLSEEWHVRVIAGALPNRPEESDIVAGARFEVLTAMLGMQPFGACEQELAALPLSESERTRLIEAVRTELFDPLNAATSDTTNGIKRGTAPENVRFLVSITADAGMAARYEKLPENVRNVVCSEELAHAFDTIAASYAFTAYQVTTLARQMALVMVGMATTKEFLAGTVHELGLSQERFDELTRTIDVQIFTPVRRAIINALERHNATPPAAPTM